MDAVTTAAVAVNADQSQSSTDPTPSVSGPEGATHTSPGHRPGNYIPENQCVLKEHRIGRVGAEEMKTESGKRKEKSRKQKAESGNGWFLILSSPNFSFPLS